MDPKKNKKKNMPMLVYTAASSRASADKFIAFSVLWISYCYIQFQGDDFNSMFSIYLGNKGV